MILDTLNKLPMVLFFLAALNVLRHVYYLVQTWFASKDEEEPIKYRLSNISLILLGLSISYILAVLFVHS